MKPKPAKPVPAHPTVLADLFALGRRDVDVPWTDADRAAILRHQLAQPLGRAAPGSSDTDSPQDDWSSRSYLELFTLEGPPLPILRRVKDESKRGAADADHPQLPREVSSVLYYAALSAARLRQGQSISQLDEDAFRVGLKWALELDWLPGVLRALFADTLKLVENDA